MHDPMTISLKSVPATPPPPVVEQPKKKSKRGRRILTVLFILVLIGLVVAGGYVVYTRINTSINNTNTTAAVGDAQVVAAVGKLMLLPSETPTIAIVSDLGKLQGQQFFANAQLGDVVLMYPKARKAVLYSPTQNKIIEVAPITNDQQQ